MTLKVERPDAADQGTPAAKTGSLVINLCKVRAPITIPQPRSPQLRRFSFFLSHNWQGGRRQYRLQMGYFSTYVEANWWLKTLRGIYPGAFVSDVSSQQQAAAIATGKASTGAVFATSAHYWSATVRKLVAARHRSANGAALPLQQQGTVVSGLREVGDEQYGVTVPTPERRACGTFEETLGILGTSELDVRGEEETNGTGVQDLRIELQTESPLKQTSDSRVFGRANRKGGGAREL
jgi:hypothetical protein